MLPSTSYPVAAEVEAAVLGALLVDPAQLPRVRAVLPSADLFLDVRHRNVYEAVLAITDAGRCADLVTVTAWLDGRRLPGGGAFPSSLTSTVGASSRAEEYAYVVREHALRREIGARLAVVTAEAREPDADPFDLLDAVRALADEVSKGLPGHALVPSARAVPDAAEAVLREAEEGRTPGVSTGFVGLDALLGSLRPGALYCFAGRPAMGKSALALSVAHRTAKLGNPVALFSLEMSTQENAERLLAAEADVDAAAIHRRRLMPEQRARVAAARDRLAALPIHYDDTPAITPEEVRAKLHRLTAAAPVSVVVLDYVQLMRGAGKNREEEVAYCSRSLKAIAKEYGCAVVMLAQLNRGVESRADKRPMLSDLRESGALEQDSDAVAFLYRPEYYGVTHEERQGLGGPEAFDVRGLCEVIVAKQRGGGVGSAWLRFDGSRTRFLDRHAEPGPLGYSGDGHPARYPEPSF